MIGFAAPVVLGLNTSRTCLGVTAAGVIGALAIPSIGGHLLGYVGAAIVVLALVIAELATLKIKGANQMALEEKLATA